jgi:hypothetical protein
LVNEFVLRNNICNDEIICHQYDGLLITRPISIYDQYISFGLREILSNVIISIDKNSYIALNNNREVIIKGITNRYNHIDYYYSKLLKINYFNKQSIFNSLHKIKNEILDCDDPTLFCIPCDDDKYEIFLKKYGKMKISETIINMLDVDEIDKQLYFEIYLKPFFDSVVITYI